VSLHIAYSQTALPDTGLFATINPNCRAAFNYGQCFEKALVNQPPAIGKIIITR
jgi:hypothetical protein